ncbi:ATP-binding protein [Vibrio rumoiensis]|uniref:histidine kinase n=1 Tax=Vibrio rumoiensis 1S-45 TaxID=1188252 RepID=A0A1E5DZZ0_9VIBR|nr:sensor histidine kinase [Vibrio rumoiensis]OEF23629.1 ATPase [Vibrio rumoiensis 1S-45]
MTRTLSSLSKFTFRTKIFLLLFGLLILQMSVMVWHFDSTLYQSIKHQVGTRALVQAKEIAIDPILIKLVKQKDTQALKVHLERLSKISDASFIVAGDENGIRLTHPVQERVGLPMQGGDNAGVLERGESYITLREGSLGYGIRGKAPILDENNQIIGVISVGYLLNRFDQWLDIYMKPLLIEVFSVFALTLIAAWGFSHHIRKKMNDMEPEEIAMALNLQKSVLRAVYEGIIAIDRQGYFLAINASAQKLLDINKDLKYLKTRQIIEYVSNSEFFFRQPLETNLKDEIITLNGHSLVANRVAIFKQNELIGWVISFREKSDIDSLTTELTQVQQHTDNLRVLRHEFSNRLATISGLIQMGSFDEVQQLIAQENTSKQQLLDFIHQNIHLSQVAGLLLGKSLRAKELNIFLRFDPTCQLHQLTSDINETELCAILGNLIDNAFDATQKNPTSNKIVDVLITDAGNDLVIEVTDNGTGIEEPFINDIWKKGITTKQDPSNHGIGLYLVHRYVTHANGFISVDNADPQGCIFSVFIPK